MLRQFEDLLTGDHTVSAGDGGREAVEHGGLARLGSAAHENVEAGDDRRAEEGGCLRIQGSQDHKIVEGVSASDEFLDGSKGAQCQVTAVRRRLTHRAW